MGKLKLNSFIYYAVFCSCIAQAGEEHKISVFSTFSAKELTPQSLPLLMPQLPEKDYLNIRKWVDNPLHKSIIKYLVVLQHPLAGSTGDFKDVRTRINGFLQLCGLYNLSRWNYIFEIGGTDYVIQFAGVLNRVKNLLIYNDPDPTNPTFVHKTPDALCDLVIKKIPATYQTVSRAAHYLRAMEAKDIFNLDAIFLPKTFLISIDRQMPAHVHDGNSVVIQKKILADVVPVRQMPLQEKMKIAVENVRQLLVLSIYAVIWDLNANLLFDQQNKTFVISDLEQPNTSNPSDFFLKREARTLEIIRDGISQIRGLFENVPHLKNICKQFSDFNDAELKKIGSGKLPNFAK